MITVAVIGAGSWGTTLAGLLGRHATVHCWAREPDVAEAINATHENPEYLAGIALPESVSATSDLDKAFVGAEIVVMAVPSHGYRDVLAGARDQIGVQTPVVSVTKGIETSSLMRMTEVIADVLADHDPTRTAVLTGPNLAREIAEGQPAAAVIACAHEPTAVQLQELFMAETFRVYTNPDVIGCELAGALKNVMAIAAGAAYGLGYGDNAIAALITRGLAELARLGVALGGDPLTFAGLAGMGDLIATCISPKSRNRTVGVELAHGRSIDDITASMNMVAEGVKTAPAVIELAARVGVEMPIVEQVVAVLRDGKSPADMVSVLMHRSATSEFRGLR
ncbi:MAG: NAD(P)H-dependent glycerol-3-phosphate dehydrogenase [Acidimicrobiia bacterium]